MLLPDFVSQVLAKLDAITPGQAVDVTDVALIMRRTEHAVAQLQQEEMLGPSDAYDLDDRTAMPLADIVAFACTAPYGITGSKLIEMADAARGARAALKVMHRNPTKEQGA